MAKALNLTCPECGTSFQPRHHRSLFCSPEHQQAYGNRQLARGKSITSLAQTWRGARGSKDPEIRALGKQAFTLLCRAIDAANAEDREAGRMNAVRLYQVRQSAGLLA